MVVGDKKKHLSVILTLKSLVDDNNMVSKIVITGDTRPSDNYAKDWLDHSFLFPGIVWF